MQRRYKSRCETMCRHRDGISQDSEMIGREGISQDSETICRHGMSQDGEAMCRDSISQDLRLCVETYTIKIVNYM